jgi:hypothetical protein
MFQRKAGNSSYIFYSLALTDGAPYPTYPKKAKVFLKANCFDKDLKFFSTTWNNSNLTTY